MAIMPIPAAHRNIDSAPFKFIFHNMQNMYLWDIMEIIMGTIGGMCKKAELLTTGKPCGEKFGLCYISEIC